MNVSCSGSGGRPPGNFSARFTAPVTSMACGAAQSTGMSVGWLVAGSMPRQVPAGHTFDWSMSATLPWNASCWLFGPGQLQAAQHAALAGLPPRLVARPQQADGEPAVGVELRRRGSAHGGLALLLADLLDAGRRRRRGVGAVLGAGEGPHVDRLGDLEAVLVLAVDDLRRRRGRGPASSGSRRSWRGRRCRCRAAPSAIGAGVQPGRSAAASLSGSAVMRPAISRPPSAVSSSARRVERGLQAAATTRARVGCGASGLVGDAVRRARVHPTSAPL